MHNVLIPIVPYVFMCICTYLRSLYCALCSLPIVTPPPFPGYRCYMIYTKLHICRLVQCINVSYCASVCNVLCAHRFLLCLCIYASFYVTCSVSCTFCAYVFCAPSQLSPRILFLYTVDMHKLSVCRFSNLRRLGSFSSACIDSVGTCLVGLLFTPLRLHLPSFFLAYHRALPLPLTVSTVLKTDLFTLLFIRWCPHDPRIDACAEVTVEVDHAFVSSPSLSRPCVAETCFTYRRSHRGSCRDTCGVQPRSSFHCQSRPYSEWNFFFSGPFYMYSTLVSYRTRHAYYHASS